MSFANMQSLQRLFHFLESGERKDGAEMKEYK